MKEKRNEVSEMKGRKKGKEVSKMKARKAYLGVAGILIIGLILGISLWKNFNQQRELPQLSALFKEEPQILKEKPAQEEKLVQKSAPEKIAQKKETPEIIKLSQGEKEPLFIQRLKAARIEVKEYKEMDSLSKLVTEHYKKEGYPRLNREFKAVKDDKKIKPGEVLVKRVAFNNDGSYTVSYYKVKVKQGEEQEAIDILKEDSEVYSAEPNVLITARLFVPVSLGVVGETESTENYDPGFNKQWGLKKIEADKAWKIEKGNKEVKIAVIDTGVDMEHPDLKDNIDKELSYDYINDDDDPSDEEKLGHGTHVAGIIAAVGGNGIGVHGVMWHADIIVHKIFTQAEQDIPADVIAKSITDAIDKGAKVINMSWGTGADLMQESETLKDAFETAFSSNVILVAAAGNHKDVTYPAKYEQVIAVGGTDQNDNRWVDEVIDYTGSPNPLDPDYNPYYGQPYESAYGEEVDVSAPAKDIYSTITSPDPGKEAYAYLTGTSMASPFVSGLAGLLLAYKPDLSKEELIKAIKENVDEVNTDPDKPIGGRINARKALEAIGGEETPPEGKELKAVAYVGEKGKKEIEVDVGEEVQFYGDESQAPEGYQLSDLKFQWDFGDGNNSDEMNPKHKYNKAGEYTVILVVSLMENSSSDTVTVKVKGEKPPIINAINYEPEEPKVDEEITFTADAEDPDGQIEKYEWDFGDGNKAEGKEVKHSYKEEGKYTVKLTVTDNDGNTAEKSVDIEVKAGEEKPPMNEYWIKGILKKFGKPIKGGKVKLYVYWVKTEDYGDYSKLVDKDKTLITTVQTKEDGSYKIILPDYVLNTLPGKPQHLEVSTDDVPLKNTGYIYIEGSGGLADYQEEMIRRLAAKRVNGWIPLRYYHTTNPRVRHVTPSEAARNMIRDELEKGIIQITKFKDNLAKINFDFPPKDTSLVIVKATAYTNTVAEYHIDYHLPTISLSPVDDILHTEYYFSSDVDHTGRPYLKISRVTYALYYKECLVNWYAEFEYFGEEVERFGTLQTKLNEILHVKVNSFY